MAPVKRGSSQSLRSASCLGLLASGGPLRTELRRSPKLSIRSELEPLVRRSEAQVGEPPGEKLQRCACLKPGQRRAETEVDAVAKRYVLVSVLAEYIELLRVLEDALVMVGRSQE